MTSLVASARGEVRHLAAADADRAFERYETQIAQVVDFFRPFASSESPGREVFWAT